MYSNSEIFHVMLRGIGHMDLFYDDNEYSAFLRTMIRYTEELNVPVFVYCLMNNHVHLLIGARTDVMSLLLKKTEVSYAYYFRSRYEHAGHLFQNRYKSEAIENERHFLAALRYILFNPAAAGLGDWRSYRWSSAAAYLHQKNDGLTACDRTWELISRTELLDVTLISENEAAFAEPVFTRRRKSDKEISAMICSLGGLSNPLELQASEMNKRNEVLSEIKSAGASVRQIERVTGINRNVIQRARRGESGDVSTDSSSFSRRSIKSRKMSQ